MNALQKNEEHALKKPVLILCISLIALIGVILFNSKLYHLFPEKELPAAEKEELISLGKEALLYNDVPVSALIIYDEQVIGTGFNTVFADTNAAGHAEINAITNAVRNLGWKNFFELDREKLLLISTFEPCPMCIGAIKEYKIKHVDFIKEKSVGYWLKNRLGDFYYELNKRKIFSDIQDSLFLLHPAYKGD